MSGSDGDKWERYMTTRAESGGKHAYRWQVVDRDRSGKIVARTASQETADSITKQLNEKGFVEDCP